MQYSPGAFSMNTLLDPLHIAFLLLLVASAAALTPFIADLIEMYHGR